jgi:hypothetical protein
VLVLVFNRPAVARQLLEAVRVARPAQLFVAADGPRAGHPTDEERCRQTQALFRDPGWPCEVHTRYLERNAGLQHAVVSAIDWFFDHVTEGIVLEDDCVPAPDFFPFAGELLDRYAHTTQVMHVSGLNMRPGTTFDPYSYGFAGVGHIWGWATWRRAWRLYDGALTDWPAMRCECGPGAPRLRRVLGRKFAAAHAGRKFTWARAWYYSTVRHGGLAIVPAVNLVRNVGFGADATHTVGGHHPLRREAWGTLPFPLVHPPHLLTSPDYERELARYHAGSYRRRASDLGWSIVERLRLPQAADPARGRSR